MSDELFGRPVTYNVERPGGFDPRTLEDDRPNAKWVKFEEQRVPETRKTRIFDVLAKQGGETLGYVSWYAPWRRYSFTPSRPPTGYLVFESDCLRDIAAFCDWLMMDRARRAGRRIRS